jgi:hypothetical protein
MDWHFTHGTRSNTKEFSYIIERFSLPSSHWNTHEAVQLFWVYFSLFLLLSKTAPKPYDYNKQRIKAEICSIFIQIFDKFWFAYESSLSSLLV